MNPPSAQALPAELAATARSGVPAGAPVGTLLHLLPFQCTISALLPVPAVPTAQAFLAEVAATATSAPLTE